MGWVILLSGVILIQLGVSDTNWLSRLYFRLRGMSRTTALLRLPDGVRWVFIIVGLVLTLIALSRPTP